MAYLLDFVYVTLLLLASPWLAWRSLRQGKYLAGWSQKFLGRVPTRLGGRPCVWLHGVSVGEVNLLAPLLAEIRRRHPEWECVISTTTATGFALAKKKYAGLAIFYCPLDFSWATAAAVRRLRPTLLVLAELELWPNLVAAARRQGARVAIVNGRLSDRSLRGYQKIRPLAAWCLGKIDLIAVQTEEYRQRFAALRAPARALHVSGSIKFDGALTNRNNPLTQRLRGLAGFQADDMVFLAGSTQEPEESLALATFRELAGDFPRLRLVIVPRHPERFETVARMLDQSGVPWQRRSSLEGEAAEPRSRVLLIDAVGELGAWWGTAHIGFVGGSLSRRGGQNMIEPAAYGVAVSFGPHTQNFRDMVLALLAESAAVVVNDGAELTAFARRCLVDGLYREVLGERASNLVSRQLGATARTVELLARLVEPDVNSARAA